ncbi:class F sortase [Paenibacillus glucanolyticus]|uniref:class F sortase n=1 Tax=Paenibacillus glucanolyticus TaxID=59843 RepID=UPI00096EFCAB|nr:class F sortase [Paenibacillus glucanolyticus]OMF68254.1 peptidase C60 sortase A and B [Paenibacillus glucanolyticus]
MNEKILSPILIFITIILLFGCQHNTDATNLKDSSPKSSAQTGSSLSVKTNKKKEEKKEVKVVTDQHPAFIIPNKIWIPSIGLEASVQPVGLLENGQMEAPVSSNVAGVFIDGVLPGQQGNAIIAGHVDNYTGPAIFYPLKKVKPGAPVVLSDKEGNYLVFKVVAVESYATAEAPIERIFGDSDIEQLNLITCTGRYNREKKEHEKRLVVYTRMLK